MIVWFYHSHPCKFPDATNNAINENEKLPDELQHVLNKDENFQVLKNNTEEVKNFVKSKLKGAFCCQVPRL